MLPQDWAQITFRSEIHSNQFKELSGRWIAKGKYSRSGELIIHKSPDLDYFLLAIQLPDNSLNKYEVISNLKVICSQSWGYIEALQDLRSLKTSSQQPYS